MSQEPCGRSYIAAVNPATAISGTGLVILGVLVTQIKAEFVIKPDEGIAELLTNFQEDEIER